MRSQFFVNIALIVRFRRDRFARGDAGRLYRQDEPQRAGTTAPFLLLILTPRPQLYASPLHGDGETPKPLHDIYTESDRKVQGAHRDLSVLRQSCAVSGNVASTSPAGKQ